MTSVADQYDKEYCRLACIKSSRLSVIDYQRCYRKSNAHSNPPKQHQTTSFASCLDSPPLGKSPSSSFVGSIPKKTATKICFSKSPVIFPSHAISVLSPAGLVSSTLSVVTERANAHSKSPKTTSNDIIC
ncbi:hypothetical protein CEXT_652751 [Caerostris extrusa]|uniref:Uncharacterized protein n=1 Tax=Caerostris extrusa TaxID=172846 RepID=A0AAV4M4E5_CAEEX|nr:hypothetical protein CEXT_652751 [Caerostris extrusa]